MTLEIARREQPDGSFRTVAVEEPEAGGLPDPVTEPVHIATGVDENQLTIEGITGQNESLARINLGGTTPGVFVDAYDGGYAALTVGDYQLIAGGRVSLNGTPDSGSVSAVSPSGQNSVEIAGSDDGNLTFRFKWSQNTSDSNPTIVKAGSFFRYRRLN